MTDDFPTDEIDGIIREEIIRGHETNLWTKPQARRRYQKLLAARVIGGRGEGDGVGVLVDAIFDAHYELSPYCTDSDRLFAFAPDATQRLVALLSLVRGILGRTLSAELLWPADSVMPHDQGREFLLMQHEQLRNELAQAVALGGARGGTVAFRSQRAVLLDQSLQVCRYLLMTGDESRVFDGHYTRAQRMLRQAGPLFNGNSGMTSVN